MTHQAKKRLNLDITKYKDEDIISLLGVQSPYTKDKLLVRVNKYINKYKNNHQFLTFFLKVEDRIHKMFTYNEAVREGFEGSIAPPEMEEVVEDDVIVSSNDIIDEDEEEEGTQELKDADEMVLPEDIDDLNVDNSNFNKGSAEKTNELVRKKTKQIINVDSSFRKDYLTTNSNNFVFTLPVKLTNVLSLKLSSIELPNTFYLFSDSIGNTSFTINMRYYGVDVCMNDDLTNETDFQAQSLTVNIPEGTWENSELASEINNYFDSFNGNPDYNYFYHLKFEVRDQDIRPMLRFKNTLLLEDTGPEDQTRLRYDVIFDTTYNVEQDYIIDGYVKPELRNTAGWILGYRKSKYYNIGSPNTYQYFDKLYNGVLRAEALYAADKFNYVFFSVEDFNNTKDSIISAYQDIHISKSILGRISIKFGTFFVNLDDAGDRLYKQRDYPGPVTIEKLQISVLNRYGELLDFNNSDFSLTFEAIQIL